MEENYDWELILKVALPISAIVGYTFYTNINNVWKWSSLILGMFASGAIIYRKDKKKNNVFTAVGIIFLVALIIRFLKNSGIL